MTLTTTLNKCGDKNTSHADQHIQTNTPLWSKLQMTQELYVLRRMEEAVHLTVIIRTQQQQLRVLERSKIQAC
jgi:hypothetical protein